jgi:hypothetical protein
MTIGGVAMMVHISAKLTLTMMAIVPPIALGAVVYGRFLKRLATQTQTALADIQPKRKNTKDLSEKNSN